MNISVNVDCTPEEARRFMGLPDMGPVHDLYLDRMKQTMTEGLTPETVERLVRGWSPMGEMGMNAWKQLMDHMAGVAKG